MTTTTTPVIDVHNVWTIHGLNADGSKADQPLATMSRPQDWGDPRWHYEQFRFEWVHAGTRYINNFHGWTDLERDTWQYPLLFASLLVQVLMPGTDPRLCGRDYLAEEDFWESAWGDPPPFAPTNDEDGLWVEL